MNRARPRRGLVRRSVRHGCDNSGWCAVIYFGGFDPSPPRQSAPRVLMRAVRDQGGQVRACAAWWDDVERGRMVTLTAFYPGDSGYPEPRLLP